ncbi:SDR family oxidoreductase [Scytonema tolypothrichoides VB-61278]|nr:SDR family oxidoreductase [Scytonema tolypothrichoides VB-61278]
MITGASSGIGAAFAHTLAQRGMNLILVARSESKLQALSTELNHKYKIRTDAIAADLSYENMGLHVYEQTQKRQLHVDMLINNAGFSTNGNFETIPPDKDHQQVMLNVVSVVDLTHAFIPAMLERGEGTIINIGSTTSFYPLAYQAVYGATKAFILSFSEALWAEYRERGIKVLALCPGATDTAFFNTMGRDINFKKHSPQDVVRIGLSALEQNRHYVIPGFRNTLESNILPRLLPRVAMAKLVSSISPKAFKSLA